MESPVKSSHWSENLLFVFLGALSAVILSLGTFGAADARTPASQESSFQQSSEISPRVFLSID